METIHTFEIETPLGPMLAGANARSVCFLEFIDRDEPARQLQRLEKRFQANLQAGSLPLFQSLARQLQAYFANQRRSFDLPLELHGTAFQQQVWMRLQEIPYGKTWTYQQLADSLGNRESIRAAARANGENPLAILVPCHRVIGGDGSLTGYAGGLARKQFLLALEGALPQRDNQPSLPNI